MKKAKKPENAIMLLKHIAPIIKILVKDNPGSDYKVFYDDGEQRLRIDTNGSYTLNYSELEPIVEYLIKNNITWNLVRVDDRLYLELLPNQ